MVSLAAERQVWQRKPVLRAVYGDIYARLSAFMQPGTLLEVGGGSGNLKQYFPAVVSMDIQEASWLDVVGDAQRLPFATRSFDNIVMVDVLHHIEWPVRFFREARRQDHERAPEPRHSLGRPLQAVGLPRARLPRELSRTASVLTSRYKYLITQVVTSTPSRADSSSGRSQGIAPQDVLGMLHLWLALRRRTDD